MHPACGQAAHQMYLTARIYMQGRRGPTVPATQHLALMPCAAKMVALSAAAEPLNKLERRCNVLATPRHYASIASCATAGTMYNRHIACSTIYCKLYYILQVAPYTAIYNTIYTMSQCTKYTTLTMHTVYTARSWQLAKGAT